MKFLIASLVFLFISCSGSRNPENNSERIGLATMDKWSAPYRNWNYYPAPIIPSDFKIPGHEDFHSFDVPTVYQLPDEPDKWYMGMIGYNGKGYNSFVVESADLVHWETPRLAMGFGEEGEFDYGGHVIGAYLYQSYEIKAPRVLKKEDGKYWPLYGSYAKQGAYEIDPGYEGVAASTNGTTWLVELDGKVNTTIFTMRKRCRNGLNKLVWRLQKTGWIGNGIRATP